jgi:phosphoribosylanthranilate isomerase
MWIKICGLIDPAIAREIARLRPDAIGLNFYERSVRFVTAAAARQIADELPPTIEAIGIFVEATGEQMRHAAARYGLRGVQLHSPAESDSLGEFDVEQQTSKAPPKWIRAFQIGTRGLAPVAEYFQRHQGRSSPADAYLLDAHAEGLYGGTGQMLSWDLLRNEYQREEWPPLILAGGLRPENVAEAIEAVRPWGVDVASGVESSPGIKDVTLVARFIDEARRAFAKLGRDNKARSGAPE